MPARSARAAVLLTVAAVPAQDGLEARVTAALDRARPALRSSLRDADGGPLALLCLAAAHDRVPVDEPVFAAALRRLARANLHDTYGLSLRLMVRAHVESFADRDGAAQRDTGSLLGNQAPAGGFSYSARPRDWDLSNTQYAALGLRAADHLGVDVPLRAWNGIARATRSNQARDGGFGYASRNGATLSMTVAGVAVLELCKQQLGRRGAGTRELTDAIEAGWRWLDAHAATVGDLGAGQAYYAHYGLERAAVLSGRDAVGGTPWFERGATAMLALQRPDGSFVRPGAATRSGDPVETAFAVLFLRRSFQRELGPVTPGPAQGCHVLAPAADEASVRAAVAHDVARGDRAVPDLLQALRSEHEVRRRAAALALLRIAGEDFRYHPARTAEQNAIAILRAERWWAERQAAGGR